MKGCDNQQSYVGKSKTKEDFDTTDFFRFVKGFMKNKATWIMYNKTG